MYFFTVIISAAEKSYNINKLTTSAAVDRDQFHQYLIKKIKNLNIGTIQILIWDQCISSPLLTFSPNETGSLTVLPSY